MKDLVHLSCIGPVDSLWEQIPLQIHRSGETDINRYCHSPYHVNICQSFSPGKWNLVQELPQPESLGFIDSGNARGERRGTVEESCAIFAGSPVEHFPY